MRLGPKALVGLGLPAALRPHAPKKGVVPPSGFVFLTDPDGAYLTETVDGVVYYLSEDI